MNYKQTLEYLYSQLPMFQRIGAAAYKADLRNTLALVELLGHPENDFPSVHIAGTNGKGSIAHMLASVLQEAGYKTGLYTSPHLKDFRERIKINGRMIPEKQVIQFVTTYRNRFDNIKPSFFEYTAVMAFDFFSREEVDIAILETGMGGRLDSTNVVTPILSVITNISLDHTSFLGSSVDQIATEKAGIIKPEVPVIIGEYQGSVSRILKNTAQMNLSPIHFADKHFKASKSLPSGDGNPGSWTIQAKEEVFIQDIICPLEGNYQAKNIATVAMIAEVLIKEDFTISKDDISRGLENVIINTGLNGRWQIIMNKPKVICDIGHNEAGIQYILEQLESETFNQLHWVIGMVKDKEAGRILGMLPASAHFYFCRPDIPRGKDALELKKEAGKYGLRGKAYPSVKDAYSAALKNASVEDLIFIGGSTFVVAEVL